MGDGGCGDAGGGDCGDTGGYEGRGDGRWSTGGTTTPAAATSGLSSVTPEAATMGATDDAEDGEAGDEEG